MNYYKIIFLGDKKVLKQNFLDSHSSEVDFDFYIKITDIEDYKIKLLFCKLTEKDKFQSLISNLKKEINFFIIVYDISNKNSFLNSKLWIEELKSLKIDNSFCYLVGYELNSENEREVEEKEAEAFAKEKEITYKSGEKINELLEEHIYKIIIKKEKDEEEKKEKEEKSNEKMEEEEIEEKEGNEIINDKDKEDKEKENEDSEEELNKINLIEPDNKKCSLEEHNKIDANSFCQECKIFLCNKCKNIHNGLLKNHHSIILANNMIDQFIDICKEKGHIMNLDYFCKTHNILCCAACITKIKGKGNGKHNECDICFIEDIADNKKNLYNINFEYLKEISFLMEEKIHDLKKYHINEIDKKKEELKNQIQTFFTKLRNKINNKEDELLLKVDNKYDELFINEKFIRKNEIYLNNIKKNLEKWNINDNDWNNKSNLSLLINNSINIEKNIKYIEDLKKKIDEKCNNYSIVNIKFCPKDNNNEEIDELCELKMEKFLMFEEFRILMLGLDYSGKTTILYQLKMNETVKTIPTIGFNVETISDKMHNNYTIWDVGGQDKLRCLWKHYYSNTDGIIYVVDSNDQDRMDDNADIIKNLCNEEELKNCPILVFANKQDLNGALSPSDVTKRLGMGYLKGRRWLVSGASGKTGLGIKENFDWLTSEIIKSKGDYGEYTI